MERTPDIAVVGAGIVGVCTALYLQRDGRSVALVDEREPGQGASFGNAGVIALDHVAPIGKPGVLWQVPGMLLDPLGPFAIRAAYLPRMLPWLLRFVRASTPSEVERLSQALVALVRHAFAAYAPLLEQAGARDMMHRRGWIAVYASERRFAETQPDRDYQRRFGVRIDDLTQSQIRQFLPQVAPSITLGAFYPDSGHVVHSHGIVAALANDFVRRGGQIMRRRVEDIELAGDRVTALATGAGRIATGGAVIAAGAWSKGLAARLGAKVPLDTERGYHMTLPNPKIMPSLPVFAGDSRFFMTPMEHGLRLAGTVELGGLKAEPNWRRADILFEGAAKVLPGLSAEGATRWMGFRPTLPDSLPVIGAAPGARNAWLAFGHQHLGLTLGAITGQLVAELVAGRAPAIDLAPYRPDRFGALLARPARSGAN
jgi:D-amino-acid dehydrogenase